MSLWLQGRSRMSLDKLRTQVRILTKFEDVSEFILIHIGDIAKIDLKEPRKENTSLSGPTERFLGLDISSNYTGNRMDIIKKSME